jgi:hypothetical protein
LLVEGLEFLAQRAREKIIGRARRGRDDDTDGPEDSALTLIRFDTERGEYWDRSGVLRLEFLWEAGRALIKGEMLDEDRLSGHGKVGLGN